MKYVYRIVYDDKPASSSLLEDSGPDTDISVLSRFEDAGLDEIELKLAVMGLRMSGKPEKFDFPGMKTEFYAVRSLRKGSRK